MRTEPIDVKPKTEGLEDQGRSVLATVSRELAQMERRDWELWTIVLVTGVVVSAGLLALIFPSAFVTQGEVRLELHVSKEMFLGLVALLVLFNTYMVSRRLELRRVRQHLISSTIQGELARLQSLTDPLTQVNNRRSLDEMVRRYSSHARRLRTPLTFLLIDVDRFKDVNTRFGHLIGDFVIAETATLLKGCVRGSDAVIRYGGDEFILILADTSREGAIKVTERMAKSVEEWNNSRHLDGFDLSCSVGVSEWKDGRTLEEILNEADREMYSTKSARASLL